MNRKKVVIFYIPIVVIFAVIIGIVFTFSRQIVEKDVMNAQTNTKNNWKSIMAKKANENKINLYVDGKKAELDKNKVYMNHNMTLMVDINVITNLFNCAQNVYDNKRIVVEKGSNVAVMYIDSRNIIYNDTQYKLNDYVVKKNNTIYIPATVFKDYFNYNAKWTSKNNSYSFTDKAIKQSYLPKRYSYLDKKRSVPAKNQGNYGTCWAFATLTALETSLMPEEKFDFSENNLIRNNAMSEDIQDGGDYMMSMAYLMAWKGPVLDSDDPYGSSSYNPKAKVVKHVQEAQILPEKDYKQIKEMIYKYGGVESSMYMSMKSSASTSVYYNQLEYAYCYKGNKSPNHDVVIIGWDDNYSKELFNDSSIEGDGAFICMNSWGSNFGYNGTFYVSYYDDCIGTNNVCYTDVENTDNYDNIYQSDLCGWTGSMGFENEKSAYFSNVYKAKNNEKLTAVGFYVATGNVDYQVFVCEQYKGVDSLKERSHVAASGIIKNKGYYTIKLDKKYQLKKDKKFCVTIKATNKNNDDNFKIIPVEMQTKAMEGNVDLTDGEGYFSSAGTNWQSAEEQGCNICLKAYTLK